MKLQISTMVASMLLTAVTAAHASVEISTNPTVNMNCSGGVCSPTAKKAVLNTIDLANMLATSDVKIATGNGAVTITVSGPFSWTSTHRLTLDANLTVSFRAPVEVAGQGAVTIITNDGGAGGDLLFFPGSSLDFWDTSSSLVINGKTFAFVKNVKSLASSIIASPSGNFALAKNYDAKNDKVYRDCPVTTTFLGSFEGLGHSIQNLTIKELGRRTQFAALFYAIGAGGVVRDFGLINGNVTSAKYDNGGVAALLVAENAGTVIHTFVSGIVQLDYRNQGGGGGLAGGNVGTISDSHSSAAVYPGQYNIGGGLVAFNNGTIDGSYADGDIPGAGGGLVGINQKLVNNSHASGKTGCGGLVCQNVGNAIIQNSYSTGDVFGQSVGGLAGYNGGLISGSYATGNVTADYEADAGGLVGFLQAPGIIEDSYATGSVSGGSGDEKNGGLIGESYDYPGENCSIKTSYAIGLVSVGGYYNGGVVGSDSGYGEGERDYGSAYWDLDTSGINNAAQGAGDVPNDPGITGLTDAQLKSGLPPGFVTTVWAQNSSINNGYPYLINNPPPQ